MAAAILPSPPRTRWTPPLGNDSLPSGCNNDSCSNNHRLIAKNQTIEKNQSSTDGPGTRDVHISPPWILDALAQPPVIRSVADDEWHPLVDDAGRGVRQDRLALAGPMLCID